MKDMSNPLTPAERKRNERQRRKDSGQKQVWVNKSVIDRLELHLSALAAEQEYAAFYFSLDVNDSSFDCARRDYLNACEETKMQAYILAQNLKANISHGD